MCVYQYQVKHWRELRVKVKNDTLGDQWHLKKLNYKIRSKIRSSINIFTSLITCHMKYKCKDYDLAWPLLACCIKNTFWGFIKAKFDKNVAGRGVIEELAKGKFLEEEYPRGLYLQRKLCKVVESYEAKFSKLSNQKIDIKRFRLGHANRHSQLILNVLRMTCSIVFVFNVGTHLSQHK